MRVEGATWNDVAAKLNYANGESARCSLQTQHRDEWDAAYEEFRAKYMAEIESEAALTQRSLLRPFRNYTDRDGKPAVQEVPVAVSQSAAHSLLSHAVKDRAQRVEISGPSGAPIGIVLDASQIDNGRPHEPASGA